MKALELIRLLQETLTEIESKGIDPKTVEVCAYAPNQICDWVEITKVEWEYGTPHYILLVTVPRTE